MKIKIEIKIKIMTFESLIIRQIKTYKKMKIKHLSTEKNKQK